MNISMNSFSKPSTENYVEDFIKLIFKEKNGTTDTAKGMINNIESSLSSIPRELRMIVIAYQIDDVINTLLDALNWEMSRASSELLGCLVTKIGPFVKKLSCTQPLITVETVLATTLYFPNIVEFTLIHCNFSEKIETVVARLCESMKKLHRLDISECKQLSFNTIYSTVKRQLPQDSSLRILSCRAFAQRPHLGYRSIMANLTHVLNTFKNSHPQLTIQFTDVQEGELQLPIKNHENGILVSGSNVKSSLQAVF